MVKIVNSLESSIIATLLEFFAIVMGLFIAWNLKHIVTLSARQRLFSRGTARLRDSTWNVGIIEGLLNPRLLLRDCRVFFAFWLCILVVSLEVLTVLQTQPDDTCTFTSSAEWDVIKSKQKCFKLSERAFFAEEFLAEAKKKAKDIDVNVGLPVNTDIFEQSVIIGAAVAGLLKYESRYTVNELSKFDTIAKVVSAGLSRASYKAEDPRDADGQGVLCNLETEEFGFSPRNLELLKVDNNVIMEVASTGFVEAFGCEDVLSIRVCDYVGGKRKFLINIIHTDEIDVRCTVHQMNREGRRASPVVVASALYDVKDVDTESIRKAVMTALIAENSASHQPCERYIAMPKACTSIGSLSLSAIGILLAILVSTSLLRIFFYFASRNAVAYNGSEEELARSIFEHFDGTHLNRKDFITPGKRPALIRRLANFCIGQPLAQDDIHVSVLRSSREPDTYHLTWTRDPIAVSPALHVPNSSVIPTVDAREEVEVSLV